MVFFAYILTRIFTNIKEIRIDGDEARHLKTATKNYTMWNNSFYDFHPPLYSLLIWKLKYLMPAHTAGILISFVSSVGLYWVSGQLLHVLGLASSGVNIALLFMAFNYTLIYFSNRIFRYQLFAFLFISAFYCLLTGHVIFCGILWGLTTLTCSFNGLRFFYLWLVWFIVNKCQLSYFIPLPIFLNIYLTFWLIPKMMIYQTHKYYPSGTEGKLDIVNPFTLKQLLSPIYFPFSYAYYGKKLQRKSLKGWWSRLMGIWGLYPVHKIVYLIAPIFAFFTIKGMFKSPLWLNISVILLLLPSLDIKYRPRNSIMVIPIIGYFLALGVGNLSTNALNLGVIALLSLFLYFNHLPFIVGRRIVGEVTSRFIDHLPLDGVLCEGLIAYSIAHNSFKRVVVMTHSPKIDQAIKETDLAIKEFDLNYAVFSERYKNDIGEGYPVIRYIQGFKLLKTIE